MRNIVSRPGLQGCICRQGDSCQPPHDFKLFSATSMWMVTSVATYIASWYIIFLWLHWELTESIWYEPSAPSLSEAWSIVIVISCLSCKLKGYFRLWGSWKLKAKVASQGMMASACVLHHPSITCSCIYEEDQDSELQSVRFRITKDVVWRWELTRGMTNSYSRVGEAQWVWYLNYWW